MRETDILIAGGGLAGSTAAAMLARRGFDVTLVDPHPVYPEDLRCEKLVGRQVELLKRTGLAEQVLPCATLDGECWVVQSGRLVDKRPADQYGVLYHTLVNTIRSTIPSGTPFIAGKVTEIANSAHRQVVGVSTGEEISARLVVVANGLNSGLRHSLGMRRDDLSKCHCITIAFDLAPPAGSPFPFRALTWFPRKSTDRMAYLTLFPIGNNMRANLFVYRGLDDPWLQDMRLRPDAALDQLMPGLGQITGPANVVGRVKVRPADLYVTRDCVKPGVVLVGDAFATSCPAAGTGAHKVFTDVERLCNVHIPRWMASPRMGVDKIGEFYADPVKVACDRFSLDKALRARSVSIGEALPWRARRWAVAFGRAAIGTARDAVARTKFGLN